MTIAKNDISLTPSLDKNRSNDLELTVLSSLAHNLNYFFLDVYLNKDLFVDPTHQAFFDLLKNRHLRGSSHVTEASFISEITEGNLDFALTPALKEKLQYGYSEDESQFIHVVNRLKALAVRRKMRGDFVINDTTEFPGENATAERSAEDLVNLFKRKLNDIETEFYTATGKQQNAAKNLREVIQSFEGNPEVGTQLDGEIYNYVVRGARLGKLYVNSADSGVGKTRSMVGQACSLAFPYLDENKNIVYKKSGYEKILYVVVEQSPDEIQTMIASYVSGVPEDRILESTLTQDDKERLEIAIEIINLYQDNFLLEWIPNPTIQAIKTKITSNVYRNNIKFVFYDYIAITPGLSQEFPRAKDDVILMFLTDALKSLTIELDIFIQSATQVNAEARKSMFRDSSCLRGSRAIADKLDVGCVTMRISSEEEEAANGLLETYLAPNGRQANVVMDVYKNRRGKITEAKIFRYFDYGTCRMSDVVITNKKFDIINTSIFQEETEIIETVEELTEIENKQKIEWEKKEKEREKQNGYIKQ